MFLKKLLNYTLCVFIVMFSIDESFTESFSRGECRDKRKDCAKLKSFDWCHKKKKAMTKLCQNTCQLCEKTDIYYTVVTKPTVKPIQSDSTSACEDKRGDCPKLANQYKWCTKRKSSMEKLCPKACGFCKEPIKTFTVVWKAVTKAPVVISTGGKCEDKLKECQFMKQRKWCETRPDQMKQKCSKTCAFCKPVTAESKLPTVNNCVNTWPRPRCAYYLHLGWCDKHSEIRENCRQTCICNIKPSTKKPVDCSLSTSSYSSECNKVCEDDPRFKTLCGRFGSDCNGNGGLAKSLNRYCKKTCGLCT